MAIEKEKYRSVLDDDVEQFAYWITYFITKVMKLEVKIAALEKQITDTTISVVSVKRGKTTDTTITPVPVKPIVNAYSSGSINAYKNRTVAGKPRDSECLASPFLEINKLKKTFDSKCSIKLEAAIRSKRKICRKVNTKQWVLHFKKFRVEGHIKKQRIKKVLLWYIVHFGEEFVPKAYSAKSFCDKFLNIEDAMDRAIKNAEEGKRIVYKVKRT